MDVDWGPRCGCARSKHRGRGPEMREFRRGTAQKVRCKPSSGVTVYVMAMLPRTSDVFVAQQRGKLV